MGVLFAKVNGVWEEVTSSSPPVDEVWVGTTPTDPAVEIWYEPGSLPDNGVLRAKVAGVWEVVGGNISEIEVSPIDPLSVNPDAELWYEPDILPDNGILRIKNAGVWEVVGGPVSEVEVAAADPLATNPDAELWWDTTDDPGTMRINVGGTWVQVTQREVFVDDEDPLTRVPPSPEAELWYDTTAGVLKVQEPLGTWTEITGAPVPTPAPLDEVWVGDIQPRDASTELWYDTDAVPSTTSRAIEQLRAEIATLRLRLDYLERK